MSLRLGCKVLVLVGLAGCGTVRMAERPAPWLGTRKKTLAVGEEALRAAMAEAGVRKVDAPGNEEPVMVNSSAEGAPVCLNGAWFTLDGAPKDMLGERYQYAWKLCAGGKKSTLGVACVQVTKSESSTDSKECEGGRVAWDVASRTDRLMSRLRSAK